MTVDSFLSEMDVSQESLLSFLFTFYDLGKQPLLRGREVIQSSTGSVANPWRFAAGYFDSNTGLYKFGTRYYNPGFGRWSQQDPLRGQLNDPTSLNRYLYAGDDPVNFTDPSGRDWSVNVISCIVAMILAFLGFIVGGLMATYAVNLLAMGTEAMIAAAGGIAAIIMNLLLPAGLIIAIALGGYLIALITVCTVKASSQ